MKTLYCLSLCFLLFSCNNQPHNFETYSTLEKTIYLDEKAQLAGIQTIDFNKKGDILITDLGLKQTLLFDNAGKLLKKLSMESCHPGFNWDPLGAKFSPKGAILVLMNSPIAAWFNSKGECLTTTKAEIKMPTMAFVIGKMGDFYMVERNINETIVQSYDSLGTQKKSFTSENSFPNATRARLSNSIQTGNHNTLIVSLPFDEWILHYDLNGNLLEKENIEEQGIKFAKKDITPQQSRNGDIIHFIEDISSNVNTWFIRDKYISVFFNHFNTKVNPEERYAIIIKDKQSGEQKTIMTNNEKAFIGANGNLFYATFLPNKEETKKICPKCGNTMT